jgi:anti-sigma factor RsiW
MTEPWDDLASQLPRHRAPAELRVAIVEAMSPPRRERRWWWAPALSAAATAMAMAFLWVSVLPRVVPSDPLQRLQRAVLSEHARTLLWGEVKEVVFEELPWLTQETGIDLHRVFVGDNDLTPVGGEPLYLEGQRGLSIHYKDGDEHVISYILLPAPGLVVPDRKRVQVGRYRPGLYRSDGFALLVWKQGDLACFLISDMVSDDDLERFKSYFVRIRETSEPYVAR